MALNALFAYVFAKMAVQVKCNEGMSLMVGRMLGEVECVDCGQCAAVCPTGALTPRSEVEDVWAALVSALSSSPGADR